MPHLSAYLLPSAVGHQYYTTFYVLAFLLNQALLLWEGRRRGYPLRPWLLLTTGVTLAFIVGTKLIAMPLAEWPALWQHGQWPTDSARSVLGGALGSTLAALLLRRWLGFGWHALDAFVLPMCAAYALQCVGCLLTGCCFGHVADWGVSYAPGTLPYLIQQQRGLLPLGAAHSLPLVPTQALAGLLALGTGALVWALRGRPWPGGSWRLLQVGLLLAGRFGLEFWRDPAGEQVGAELYTVAGVTLKLAQWVLLPLALLLLGWWWRRSRRPGPPAAEVVPPSLPLRNLLGVAALLAATAGLAPGALTLPELLVVKTGLTVVLALELASLLRRGAARPRRLGLPLGLASVVLLFTNQAPAPADSTAPARHFFAFSLGAAAGGYDEDQVIPGTTSSGCSGQTTAPQRRGYYHHHGVRGGSISYQSDNPRRDFAGVGLGVWVGTDRQGVRDMPANGPFLTGQPTSIESRRLFSLNPYVEFHEANALGGDAYLDYRLGLHMGRLVYPHRHASFEVWTIPVLPDFLLRIGRPGGVFGQLETGYGPAAVGNYSGRIGLGSGLKSTSGGYILGGLGYANHAALGIVGFVSGRVKLGNSGFAVEPYLATNFGRLYQVSGQVTYRLPLPSRR